MSAAPEARGARGRLGAVRAVLVIGLVLAASTAGVPAGPRAHGSTLPATREHSVRLHSGLWLTVIRYPHQPNEVRILTVTPSLGPTLDVQPGRDTYPIWVHPSTVAARHGDLAIVNAAFVTSGVPVHASLVDGELWTSGTETADALAVTPDGDRAFVGRPVLSMAARLQDGVAFPVANWNARLPKAARVSAYTSRGGNVTPPPGLTSPAGTDPSWCAARLTPTTDIGWTGVRRTGLMRAYVVEDQPDPCPQTPERVGPTSGAVVLAGRAGTDGGRRIRALMPGDAIQLAWSFAGWPGVTDVVGGTPILVSQGRNVAPALAPGESYFYSRNPRTAAGVNAGCVDARPDTVCQITIVTVDGRQTDQGWSAGWTLRQLAAQLVRRGVARAINFDGGGSTEMWVRRPGPYCRSRPATGGCLVDKPSDAGGERATTVSIGILGRPDPGEVREPRRGI